MRGSKGSDRLSCLIMQPRNVELSAARRAELLAAFDALPEDDRADLLEDVETMAFTGTAGSDFADARAIIRKLYAALGWEVVR